jgi:hypothetical protein
VDESDSSTTTAGHTLDFYALKSTTASAGFEPASLGTRGQHTNS